MSARLAEVIRRAIVGDCASDPRDPNRLVYGGIIDTDKIAAAVAVHLASPEVVERAAHAAFATDHGEDVLDGMQPGIRQHWRNVARAALAAAAGGDGTEGR